MNPSNLNANIIANAAISALKYAYEECCDSATKKSLFAATKAIIQLNRDLERYSTPDNNSEYDYDYDPSELCAAV